MSDRASIFEKPKLDIGGFAPRTDDAARPQPEQLDVLTRGSKFRSREGAEPVPVITRIQQRRRRTGRNVQFNIRATQEVIDEFKAFSEKMDWPDGLTLEKALQALKESLTGQGT
jgi:hypothetical protein